MSNTQKNEEIQKKVSEINELKKHFQMINGSLLEIAQLTATFISDPAIFNVDLNKLRQTIAEGYQIKLNNQMASVYNMLYGEQNDSNEA